MRIERAELTDFTRAYAGGGFRMSYVRLTKHEGRLLRLVTGDGRMGLGEIARPLRVDPSHAIAAEDARCRDLSGRSLADIPTLTAGWREEGRHLFGLAAALETAWLDLIGRAAGVPVSTLLGGPATRVMPEYFSLSSATPEAMAETARSAAQGFPVIQAKLGIDDLDTDMRRVESVLAAMAPDQMLMGDFNEALTPGDARRALTAIRDPRLVWEEPCSGYDANLEVAHALGHPVMFDQCLTGLPTFLRAIRDGAAAILAVKPAPLGGLSVACTARDLAAAAGTRIRIDGPWSGQIGAAAILHLAMGAAPHLLTATLDVTAPLETGREMIRHPGPGLVSAIEGPGLGPIPEEISALEDPQ